MGPHVKDIADAVEEYGRMALPSDQIELPKGSGKSIGANRQSVKSPVDWDSVAICEQGDSLSIRGRVNRLIWLTLPSEQGLSA